MPDIPDIKVKVAIEYDGSGIEEAKKDLASLAEMADSFSSGAGSAGDGLAALDEQASKSAEHMRALTSATEDARQAIGQLVEDGAPGQEMLSSMSDAIEEMQTPLEDTTRLLEAAAPPMAQLAEHAQSMVEQLAPVSDGFVQIGEVMGGMNEHAQGLASSMGDLAPQIEEGRRAIWQLVEGGAPGQQMLIGMAESAGGAGESLVQLGERAQSIAAPMEAGRKAIWQLVEGGAPGQQMLIGMGEAAQTLQGQLPPVSDGFTRIGESLSQTVPMLPQFAEGLQVVDASAGSHGIGSFADNIAAFQDALVNPAPFEAIASHLIDTGQTWGEFTSSIGEQNANMLRSNQDFVSGLQDAATQTGSSINQVNDSLSATGTNFNEASGGAAEFTQQFTATGAAASDASKSIGGISSAFGDAAKSANEGINAFGGVGDKLYGPLEQLASLKPVGLGEAFSGVVGGAMDLMNQIAMPIMAAQMIGMVVGQVATGIYDMAAIAEGPAAHSVGTFTGSVDALGQTAQRSASQFSESFGRQIIPTLDALNYQASQGGGAGGPGGFLGGLASFLFNASEITTFINPVGGAEGIANQFASLGGMPEPFQGPPPVLQAQINYQQQLASMPQTVQGQTYQAQLQSATLLADATNPGYLQAQDNLGASQQIAQRLQQSYNISHPVNQAQLLQDAQYQQYAQKEGPLLADAQNQPGAYDFAGYWGGVGDWFNKLFTGNAPGKSGPSPFNDNSSPFSNEMNNAPYEGCFTAGTRVRMSDGSENAIETLQIGDAVLARAGVKQVSTSIRALILPPPKRVYTLTFSDGNTLTLTDAHPISTTHGWKSIEPKATAKENPSLVVSRLMWGDVIHTLDGTVQLASITPCKGKVQVYNITVGNPHTFYANGVLVHNKLQSQVGQQAADQIGGIQLPHIDLSGMASTLSGDFSSIQLPHMDLSGMASGVGSAFSGISLPHLDLSGMASGIGSAFSGISLPHIDLSSISSSLSGAFSGISLPSIPNIGAQISSAVSGMFSGISLPSIPNIGAQVSGALSGMFGGISLPSIPNIGAMVSGAMSGMFGGISLPSIPDIGAMLSGAMSGMFGGISLPSIPDLGAMLSGAMSGMFGGVSTPSVPAFASGVQGFAGGGAIIGEAGTEVAEYNGHYSLFDQGATFVNLPAGASVYPIQDMSTHGSPRMLAQGTGGGGFSPISLGGGGGNTPQSINLSVHLDSQAILSAIGLPLSQNIRLASGQRGF